MEVLPQVTLEQLGLIGMLIGALIYSLKMVGKVIDKMGPLTQALHSITLLSAKLAPEVENLNDEVKKIHSSVSEKANLIIEKLDSVDGNAANRVRDQDTKITAAVISGVAISVQQSVEEALSTQRVQLYTEVASEVQKMHAGFGAAISKAIQGAEAAGVPPQDIIRTIANQAGDMQRMALRAMGTAPLTGEPVDPRASQTMALASTVPSSDNGLKDEETDL